MEYAILSAADFSEEMRISLGARAAGRVFEKVISIWVHELFRELINELLMYEALP